MASGQTRTAGSWFDTENPYTGEVWAKIARGNAADVDKAVAAAKAAFDGVWGTSNPTDRGKLLCRLADIIDREADRLGHLEVRDNGKLLAEMGSQTKYIGEWYRYFGGLADKIEGTVIPTDKPNMFNFTRYEPFGVVGLITPWNSPLLLVAYKLAPALAAGNTAVIKPSEFTSASTLEFMELIAEAGFPDGVVNVVTGFGAEAGGPLVDHPDVSKIAFTGSDASGQKIYEQGAKKLIPCHSGAGRQIPEYCICRCGSGRRCHGRDFRHFCGHWPDLYCGFAPAGPERSIHDDFVARLVEVAKTAKIGDPMSLDTHVGPVTTPPQFKKVMDYLDIAKAEGANCILGGGAYKGEGAKGSQFVQPTIFTGVSNDMRIAQEEVFGPVLSVIPFDDEDEAVQIGNDINFGLAAGVWTSDIGRAIRMSERLRAGTVWVNTYRVVSYMTPFGGYKRSGLGRENGQQAIMAYLQQKSVWIATETSAANPFIMK